MHKYAKRVKAKDYRFALSATDTIMNDTFWVGIYPGMTGEMIA